MSAQYRWRAAWSTLRAHRRSCLEGAGGAAPDLADMRVAACLAMTRPTPPDRSAMWRRIQSEAAYLARGGRSRTDCLRAAIRFELDIPDPAGTPGRTQLILP